MAQNIYEALSEGGGWSLPYLIHIYDSLNHLYVINDNQDLEYNGHAYKASSFNYVGNNDASGTLDIELVNNDILIDIAESNYQFSVEVIGIFYDGEVTPIAQYHHRYCDATWDGKSMQLNLQKDDRLDMTFPALIFSSYNNRGNS